MKYPLRFSSVFPKLVRTQRPVSFNPRFNARLNEIETIAPKQKENHCYYLPTQYRIFWSTLVSITVLPWNVHVQFNLGQTFLPRPRAALDCPAGDHRVT